MANPQLNVMSRYYPAVYVADNDIAVGESIDILLQTQDIAVQLFDTGRSLLRKTLREPPACIIMDANMPDIDGATLVREIKASTLITPVILLGGDSQIANVVDAVKAGCWDYLEKPFIQHALLDSVSRAISATQH